MTNKETAIVGFIIPVRHPENIRNKSNYNKMLSESIRSIKSQTNPNWACAFIGNEIPEEFPIDDRITFVKVDIPANKLHDADRSDPSEREKAHAAVRRDKGQRIKKGLEALGWKSGPGTIMFVDDDDLIHRDLVAFVSSAPASRGGFVIDRGYEWASESRWLLTRDGFNRLCGTSLLPSLSALELPSSPDELSDETIQRWFGSHIYLRDDLEARGTPMEPVPFRAAIYRVGHANNHSRRPGPMDDIASLARHPRAVLRRLLRLRPLTAKRRNEFGLTAL